MQDLKVTLVQTPLYWEDKTANLAMLEEKMFEQNSATDLIILPEMFNTGFSMDAKTLAEPMNLHTFKWMKQLAAQKKAVVTGSFIVKEQAKYYNRLVWMQPDGNYTTYDKRHLFRMMDEHHHFNMGAGSPIISLNGWKIKPLVCYDLRFPVWSRNTQEADGMAYDLVLYVANWPAARVNAWDVLLKARAVENLSYSAGVNRVGVDGNEVLFNGHSGVYNFKGETVYFADDKECIETVTLSWDNLANGRAKFPAYLDADDFIIK